MKQKHKVVMVATTNAGYQMRVYVDRRDNTALPTHWKKQALVLASNGKLRSKGVASA